ncbi:hypothetical protein [Microcoleus sp.]|uniref:hypothetical protein n=1 Tax=Microcoleus sp. TaxID=44472 RepID=UPI00403EF412
MPTLDSQESLSTVSATPWRVIGVGNVDRSPDRATYTLTALPNVMRYNRID